MSADSPYMLQLLSQGWFRLRLSSRVPQRSTAWDVIILTAASQSQAELYTRQLHAARLKGHIAAATRTLVVPDPDGKRIGSGGATLGAIRALVDSLEGGRENQREVAAKQKVLLIHAGGDSKRVPWANPIGKPFIPLPLLGDEDPDGAALTLFDHILAIAAPAVAAFGERGGLLIMTGDVLPVFDASLLSLPDNGAVVVTTPTSLDVASRHGVIVSASRKPFNFSPSASSPIFSSRLAGHPGLPATSALSLSATSAAGQGPGTGLGVPTPRRFTVSASGALSVSSDMWDDVELEDIELDDSVRGGGGGGGEAEGGKVDEGASETAGGGEDDESKANGSAAGSEGFDGGRDSGARKGGVSFFEKENEAGNEMHVELENGNGAKEGGGGVREQEYFGQTGEDLLLPRVVDLLQKPSVAKMERNGALVGSGLALLDTGIFALSGATWQALIGLATKQPDPVAKLVERGQEMSLYEEMAAAWVSSRHQWLRSQPLGPELIVALGSNNLYHHTAYELTFLHFGTSGEILDHLSRHHHGRISLRHLSSVAAPTECQVAPNAVLSCSEVLPSSSVGEGSLVSDSRLGKGTRIGDRCVVLGVSVTEGWPDSSFLGAERKLFAPLERIPSAVLKDQIFGRLVVPDHCCLWQAPLIGSLEVTFCCGVDDNPKDPVRKGGTIFGCPWEAWLAERGATEDDLWVGDEEGFETSEDVPPPPRSLWTARLFPSLPPGFGLPFAMWLMGVLPPGSVTSSWLLDTWRNLPRLSLSEAHSRIDFGALLARQVDIRSKIATGIASAAIESKSLGRNLAALTQHLLIGQKDDAGRKLCQMLAFFCPPAPPPPPPPSLRLSVTSALSRPSSSSASSLSSPLPREASLPVSFDPRTPSSSFNNRRSSITLPGPADAARIAADVAQNDWLGVPSSRVHQARVDLWRAAGEEDEAEREEEEVWEAVARETAVAVGLDDAASLPSWSTLPAVGASASATLPVRLDVAGGWSDTPPWSLERVGRVLNLAVELDGERPVGAEVTIVASQGVVVSDESGIDLHIADVASIPSQLSPSEPFCIVKAALLVTGLVSNWPIVERYVDETGRRGLNPSSGLHVDATCGEPVAEREAEGNGLAAEESGGEEAGNLEDGTVREGQLNGNEEGRDLWGLNIQTWSHVPRGSGLGTSSILAAAVVTAILKVMRSGEAEGDDARRKDGDPGRGDDHVGGEVGQDKKSVKVPNDEVSRLVLLMEQKMGTGGGWQDQVGGIYGGVKCTTSFPMRPLRLSVDPLPVLPVLKKELESRLVLVFTGQVRLARDVLQKVVRRYLQRDARLISSIQRLTQLADIGRRALATVDLAALGRVMEETWQIHQELDPNCSTIGVDFLFDRVRHLSLGHKLVGAGGGGFAMLVAKGAKEAREMRAIFDSMGPPIKSYKWTVAEG